MITIYCKNTGSRELFQEGTSLLEMLDTFKVESRFPIISARVNNVSQGLKYRAFNSKDVEFLDYTAASGRRIYTRSLCFLLTKAASETLPGCRLYMEHSISNGYYCNLHKADDSQLTEQDICSIRAKMLELVEQDIQFRRFDVPTEEAVRIFEAQGSDDKVRLLKTCGEVYSNYYMLGDTADFYYGRLLPSTFWYTVGRLRFRSLEISCFVLGPSASYI